MNLNSQPNPTSGGLRLVSLRIVRAQEFESFLRGTALPSYPLALTRQGDQSAY